MLTADEAAFYEEHGYLHIPEIFSAAEVDGMADDLDRLMEQDHPSTLLWDPSDPRSE